MKQDLFLNFLKEQGLFSDSNLEMVEPDEEVSENEKVIDEMNDFEKILFACAKEGRKKCEIFHSVEDPTLEEMVNHEQHHELIKIIRDLLWVSIKGRIKSSEDSTGHAIKKGFKIVETFEKNSDDSMDGMLSAMLSGLGRLVVLSGKKE